MDRALLTPSESISGGRLSPESGKLKPFKLVVPLREAPGGTYLLEQRTPA